MTHREQSRSNSDWTDDLPHAENTSIVNHCPLEYGHFSWKIDNLQITGFFTYRDRKDKSAINMKLAQLCMGFNQNSNAEAVSPKFFQIHVFLQSKKNFQGIHFLEEMGEYLRRMYPIQAWENPTNTNSPMQMGIILQINNFVYTTTLGCQCIMVIIKCL